jgi:hypothetical protein
MGGTWKEKLDEDRGVSMIVHHTTERGEVTDYSVVLVKESNGVTETVRLYDGAHGFNEMHRFSSSGEKRSGVVFHSGTLAEGMRIAKDEIKRSFDEMVEGWNRN